MAEPKKSTINTILKFEDVPTYFIEGFTGALTRDVGNICFFRNNLIPMRNKNKEGIHISTVEQEFLLAIKLPPARFKVLAVWMNKQIKSYEDKYGTIELSKNNNNNRRIAEIQATNAMFS